LMFLIPRVTALVWPWILYANRERDRERERERQRERERLTLDVLDPYVGHGVGLALDLVHTVRYVHLVMGGGRKNGRERERERERERKKERGRERDGERCEQQIDST
jgi:hypothetical protein